MSRMLKKALLAEARAPPQPTRLATGHPSHAIAEDSRLGKGETSTAVGWKAGGEKGAPKKGRMHQTQARGHRADAPSEAGDCDDADAMYGPRPIRDGCRRPDNESKEPRARPPDNDPRHTRAASVGTRGGRGGEWAVRAVP